MKYLSQLRIFQEIKKLVLQKMNDGSMSPERGREIIEFATDALMKINTPEDAKMVSIELSHRFSEIQSIQKKFQMEEDEAIDEVVATLVDLVIARGDLELADTIMQEIKELGAEGLSQKYPEDYQKALNILKSF